MSTWGTVCLAEGMATAKTLKVLLLSAVQVQNRKKVWKGKEAGESDQK